MELLRVLVSAIDDDLLVESMAAYLKASDDMELLGSVDEGDLEAAVEGLRPDVVVLGVSDEDLPAAWRVLAQSHPSVSIIGLRDRGAHVVLAGEEAEGGLVALGDVGFDELFDLLRRGRPLDDEESASDTESSGPSQRLDDGNLDPSSRSAPGPPNHGDALRAALDLLRGFLAERLEQLAEGAVDEELLGLVISRHATVASLRGGRTSPSDATAGQAARQLAVARIFALDEFEALSLVTCAAAELDPTIGRALAFLSGDAQKRRPTPALLAALFRANADQPIANGFGSEDALVRYRLVRPAVPGPLRLDSELVCDAGILRRLEGLDVLHPSLVDHVEPLEPGRLGPLEVKPSAELTDLLDRFFSTDCKSPAELIVNLHGSTSARRLGWMRAACARRDLGLLRIRPEALARSELGLRTGLELALRHSVLSGVATAVDWPEDEQVAGEVADAVLHATDRYRSLTFLSSRNALALDLQGRPSVAHVAVHVPLPDECERRATWVQALTACGWRLDDEHLERLLAGFRFDHSEVEVVVRRALDAQLWRSPEHSAGRLAALQSAARAHLRRRNVTATRRIPPRATWDDLILPPEVAAQLQEIVDHARLEERVLDTWGFSPPTGRGRGIASLLVGPSGTGKTVAAEAVAHALGRDLLQVDLAAVLDKYVGVQEQRLSRLFDEAQDSGAVAFIDECDALFGQRGQIKEARDRWANTGVSYLLQRIEAYEGVVLLATNLPRAIDEAFLRRMRSVVRFRAPNRAERAQIWRLALPAAAPLDESIQCETLARAESLTGGNIRSAATRAAFLAAASGAKTITLEHLYRALSLEYEKLGRRFDAESLEAPETRGFCAPGNRRRA